MTIPAASAQPGTVNDADGWTRLTEPISAWGACPVWRGIEDRRYWIDPALQRVSRLHVPTGRVEHWALPLPGLLAPTYWD